MVDLTKVLVTGGQGLIGSEIDFGIKVNKEDLDVTNSTSIKKALDKFNPSAILCLSSINLRDSIKNPFLAYRVNVLGVYNLAKEAELRDIPMIIISSGSVFNGNLSDEFSEGDIPDPLNIYGQTKYLAEIIVQATVKKHLIIRTGWLFGFSKKSNFFNKFISASMAGEEITATFDQLGSPTYIKDFIQTLKGLIVSENTGIYHIINKGKASAAEICNEIILNLKSKSMIKKISITEIPEKDLKRSYSEVLTSNKIELRDWKSALKEYLDRSIN